MQEGSEGKAAEALLLATTAAPRFGPTMEIYRVPRREVAVRMLVDGSQTLEGTFFTAETGSAGHPEHALQRLNDPEEDFVPVVCTGYSVLVNKARIFWIEVSGAAADEIADDIGSGRRVPVRLTLSGGVGVFGTFVIVMPLERSRIVDYLNAADRFVPLFVDGGVKLIQRRFIVTVGFADGAERA
jgi:hypothetical protein